MARAESAVVRADGRSAIRWRQAWHHALGNQAANAIRLPHDHDRVRGCGVAHAFEYSNLRADLVGDVDDVGSPVIVVRSVNPLDMNSVIAYGLDNALRGRCGLDVAVERGDVWHRRRITHQQGRRRKCPASHHDELPAGPELHEIE